MCVHTYLLWKQREKRFLLAVVVALVRNSESFKATWNLLYSAADVRRGFTTQEDTSTSIYFPRRCISSLKKNRQTNRNLPLLQWQFWIFKKVLYMNLQVIYMKWCCSGLWQMQEDCRLKPRKQHMLLYSLLKYLFFYFFFAA